MLSSMSDSNLIGVNLVPGIRTLLNTNCECQGALQLDWHLGQPYRHSVAILSQMTHLTFGESKGSDVHTDDN